MPKFYNIYDDMGDVSTDSCTPYKSLRDALSAASENIGDYQHTIQINDNATVEITDYQARIEEIDLESDVDTMLEIENNRQLNSDYYASRGC